MSQNLETEIDLWRRIIYGPNYNIGRCKQDEYKSDMPHVHPIVNDPSGSVKMSLSDQIEMCAKLYGIGTSPESHKDEEEDKCLNT